ncbi:MAG: insulinase family protein [Candidatus Eisenbacteria bacterium]|uniref:Insulinase family protein n=1 Tax=Eiseniibacteriota bacterium TaxID=2212470 RepID=A0A948RUU1_UNCEI|nr:insulinase family protein [Candidatus Eisenbacteria bacterium]MBU1950266.1 insulinase family protein [Candidatus Eisenbacteria bacterium]MBU2689968.1 insulinase family protein [Candidatus Eisenbacteria bacterium]
MQIAKHGEGHASPTLITQFSPIGWSFVAAILVILLLWSPVSSAGPFDTVKESVLDNGLKILTVENHTSPTATIQVWYKVGSRNETQDISGVSHILEHMMFKGTEKHPTGDFDKIVQMNGMENNAFTSHDFTCYYENLASDRLEVAMELEADRMQGTIFPEEEFQSEMGVIRNERRQVLEDPPFGRLNEQVNACVFSAHSYRWPVLGWMSVLETITSDEVRNYYNNYYRPNNATLVVVGDVTHDEVVKLAKKTFGKVPRGPEVHKVDVVEPEQMGEKIVYVNKEAQLPGLIISFHAPKCDTYETKVLQVMENLLFTGESSRAFRACVYDNPLALGVGGGIYFRTDPSTFSIQAMCQPGTTAETLRDSILVLLEDLKENPVPEDELQKAKNQLLADEMFSQAMNEEIGYRLGAWESRTSWKHAVSFADDCLKVTPEDIQRVAREIFTSKNRTVGILVPEPPEVAEAN